MATQIDILKKLIGKGKIGEAITFLEANKEKEPLRNAIKKHKSLLYLASRHWVKFEGKHADELTLRFLWEMETHQFNSYIQWLPQEVLEDTFELAPIRTLFTLLLNCGANLDQIHSNGNIPLIFAVERANLGLVRFLLKKGANINAQNRVRNTPLHAAIECSNLELARFLLQNGAGINLQNSDGNTPLHLAIQHSNLELVPFLLENGADINVQNISGKSPLHLATKKGNTKIVEQLLLKDSCNLNAQDKDGKTPLHLAITFFNARYTHNSCDPRPLELLLATKIDVNAQDKEGKTPLHLAVMFLNSCNPDVTKLLLENKANANVQDKGGRAPLHWAVKWGIPSLVQLLLSDGANANVQDKEGRTPLHWAVEWGEPSLVQLLLSDGADVNAQDKNGNTPLHLAVINCNGSGYFIGERCFEEIANSLLRHDAEVTIKNHNGKIPLDYFATPISYALSESGAPGQNAEENSKINGSLKKDHEINPLKVDINQRVTFSWRTAVSESLENIKKVLSEKTYLEQQAKQPASNALLSTNRASSSRMSLNRSALWQGIWHDFSKNCQQEKKTKNARPGP